MRRLIVWVWCVSVAAATQMPLDAMHFALAASPSLSLSRFLMSVYEMYLSYRAQKFLRLQSAMQSVFFFMFTANGFFFMIVARCICLIELFVDMRCGWYLVVYLGWNDCGTPTSISNQGERQYCQQLCVCSAMQRALDLFRIMSARHLFLCTSHAWPIDRPPKCHCQTSRHLNAKNVYEIQ